jgi:hypothetical protein
MHALRVIFCSCAKNRKPAEEREPFDGRSAHTVGTNAETK